MRIESIEAIPLAIPFRHDGPPTGFAGGTWTTANYLLIKVTTSDGIIGWGEAFGYGVIPATRTVVERQLAPLAVGKDARDIPGLLHQLHLTLHVFGRGGPVVFAIGGLEIALWDIAGKQAGLPLWRLLGGGPRAAVPAYASLMRLFEPANAGGACERCAARGFKAIKLHEVRVDVTAAARAAIGPAVALMLDVNCAWSREEALTAARGLAPLDLLWLEEPVWPPEDTDAFTWLRHWVDVPMAAGENAGNPWAFKPLAACEGLDILQPSVTKVGGIGAFLDVARQAELAGKQIVPHSPYMGPGLLASLQLAAILPGIAWMEHFYVDLEAPIFGPIGLPEADGTIGIPQGAGLGADPLPEVVERYRTDR